MYKAKNQVVLSKIETDFNNIIPFVILISLLAAIFSYKANAPMMLIWIDGLIAFVFILLEFYKDKININYKIFSSIFICFFMGVVSYIYTGFESSGAILFASGNILAVLYLKRIYSIGYTFVVVFFYGIIALDFPVLNAAVDLERGEWIVQILMFLLIGSLLQIVVFSVKKYLLHSIIDLEKKTEDIKNLAYYDQMTDLPNLAYFKKKLLERKVQGYRCGFLVLAALKNYSVYSSVYGEKFTNKIVKETGKIFLDQKDDHAIVAQIGENRFALWYEGISKDELLVKYEQFREIFTVRNKKNNYKSRIDCFASFYNHCQGDDLEVSMQKVNMAMSYVVENNLSKMIEYDVAFDNRIREVEKKKELLKRAMEVEEFDVYFQTKVDARNGQVIGVEALARWWTEEFGFISPAEFIPLIERLNIAKEFGNLISKKTLQQYKGLQEKYGEAISVSINASPTYLMSDDMVKTFKKNIEEYNVPFSKVIVEITEEIAIIGLEEVNKKLQELREIGIRVSLDDFGSGYSSLNYLISFKVDEIKIDKSFVDQLENNPHILTLLESIVHVAKQFKLKLVIEGVERQEQVDKLLAIGCYHFQGYIYSKPEKL